MLYETSLTASYSFVFLKNWLKRIEIADQRVSRNAIDMSSRSGDGCLDV